MVLPATSRQRIHVVVIGAGFAGLTAARRLVAHADDGGLRVTLIDRNNYHTFQPLLYQVATAALQPQDIGHNVRNIFGLRGRARRKPLDFRLGSVVGVDPDSKQVHLADGASIGYDQLIVAAGATTADYGIDGVDEYAFPLKSIQQSMALRNHILRQFELAEASPELIDEGVLSFVIAGAGPTGVELAGAMAELVDGPLRRDHPGLDISRVRVVLVEMQDSVLPPYHSASRRYAKAQLGRRGVELRLSTAIEKVTDNRVTLAGGEEIPAATVVWTAGVQASPLAAALGVALRDDGRVAVNPDLSVPDHPDMWVIGDMAGVRDRQGQLYPQLAPVAIQQGKHVVTQLRRRLAGWPTERFAYTDKGTMATIGRGAAVSELPFGIRFSGLPAWVSWLFLHLLYLVGFRNRVAVFLAWVWNYLTYDRSARLILDSPLGEDERVPDSVWERRSPTSQT